MQTFNNRKIIFLITLFVFSFASVGRASVQPWSIAFSDDFNRPESYVIGNNWIEIESAPNVCRIDGGVFSIYGEEGGCGSGIQRPETIIYPYTVQVDLRGKCAYDWGRPAAGIFIKTEEGQSWQSGFGINLHRSSTAYDNSVIQRRDKGVIIDSTPLKYQLSNWQTLIVTFYEDGSIDWRVTDDETYQVDLGTFPARVVNATGDHLGLFDVDNCLGVEFDNIKSGPRTSAFMKIANSLIVEDDFNDGAADGWTNDGHVGYRPPKYGNWRIEFENGNGVYTCDESEDHFISLIEGISFSSHIFETRMKLIPASGATYGGIMLWFDDETREGVQIYLYTKKGIHVVESQKEFTQYPYPVTFNTWYHLRAVVSSTDNNLDFYVNGEKIFSHTLSILHNSGRSGLTVGNYGGCFDKVKVIPYGTTAFKLFEKSFTETTLTESLQGWGGSVLNNVSVTGDLNGALNFISYNSLTINSGPFAGKGWVRGEWEATIENAHYTGYWSGLSFFNTSENKVYLKGMMHGDLWGTSEGYLTETVPDSGTYDQYHVTSELATIKGTLVSGAITLDGIITYQNPLHYPATELYAYQASMEGEAGMEATVYDHYAGPLSAVVTNIRVTSEDSPYYGEGFSVISYTSDLGSGEGWGYNKLTSPKISGVTGMLDGPLSGVITGSLYKGISPRVFQGALGRVNTGLLPAADLEGRVWGPGRVSPGERINYIVELRNDGVKTAEDLVMIFQPSLLTEYISASSDAIYDVDNHEIRWNLSNVPAKMIDYKTIQTSVKWGLSWGTSLDNELVVLPASVVDPIDAISSQHSRQVKWKEVGGFLAQVGKTAGEVLADLDVTGGSAILQVTPSVLYCVNTVIAYRIFAWALVYSTYHPEYNKTFQFWEKYHEAASLRAQGKPLPNGMSFVDYIKWLYNKYQPKPIPEDQISQIPGLEILKPLDFNYFVHDAIEIETNIARDPSLKYGPEGNIIAGQKLDYKIEYENEGEGIAFGVYFTDTLNERLDDLTLIIGPVISTIDESVIADPGTYDPATRTITWFVGEVGPGEGGYTGISVDVMSNAPECTEIINYGTVYFPSVPEETRTNGIVSIVSCDSDGDSIYDDVDNCVYISNAEQINNDGDSHGDACDNCPDVNNEDQADSDGDGIGDACENTPPIANAGLDQTTSAETDCMGTITLDGSASFDPDGDPLIYAWTWDGDSADGVNPTIQLPLGITTITLVVSDGTIDSEPDEVVITVQDTTPPETILSVSPDTLWPPNHKMVSITHTVTATDNCDTSPVVEMTSITSNESEETNSYHPEYDSALGDGYTLDDIQVDEDGSIYLRAERSGTGTGRIYTITYTATDSSGNTSTASATVTVPHEQ